MPALKHTYTARTADGPILLTGATGFVGMELLLRLLERTDRKVIALVRADDDAAAQRRLDGVLSTLTSYGPAFGRGRVRAVAGDLERPGLGMTPRAHARLAGAFTSVVHCAASVSFNLGLAEARAINVEGTREILRLAKAAPALDRFVHVSTAYVAGERRGVALEREGDVGQSFRNTYEQTKLEAEGVVWDSGLPVSILRPSIVVGNSSTGWTPAFNVIYWPLQGFARGLVPKMPADPDGRVDIVPVDAVADGLMALVTGAPRPGTFHLVSGAAAPTCATLATMAAEAFGSAPPQLIAPGSDPAVEAKLGVFVPYFQVGCVYDDANASALGIKVPPIDSYFDLLMDYARAARWGKQGVPRWQVGELARRAA